MFDLTGASAEVHRLIASDWIEENGSWNGGCIAALWRLGVKDFPITPIFTNGYGDGYGDGIGYGDGYGYGDGDGYGNSYGNGNGNGNGDGNGTGDGGYDGTDDDNNGGVA